MYWSTTHSWLLENQCLHLSVTGLVWWMGHDNPCFSPWTAKVPMAVKSTKEALHFSLLLSYTKLAGVTHSPFQHNVYTSTTSLHLQQKISYSQLGRERITTNFISAVFALKKKKAEICLWGLLLITGVMKGNVIQIRIWWFLFVKMCSRSNRYIKNKSHPHLDAVSVTRGLKKILNST